jgi:drug/metabolite transporter (DMT)-like permease
VSRGTGRAAKLAGGLVAIFYMMAAAATTLVLLFMVFGTLAWPTTVSGCIGLGGVAIGSTIGTLAFFCAMPVIGALRATMISNVEPIMGIVFAVLIVGEQISVLQGVGIAMVVASIIGMEISRFSAGGNRRFRLQRLRTSLARSD